MKKTLSVILAAVMALALLAGFSMVKNTVGVHILKAPGTFAYDPDTVFKTDANGSVTITLKAA